MTKKLIPLTVYIAGPMTGLPEFNRPAFLAAEKAIAKEGFHVLNPAHNKSNDWNGYMRLALNQLVDADIVFFLRGWRNSKGASLEHKIAEELGILIRYESDIAPEGLSGSVEDQDLQLMKLEGASTAELGKAMMQKESATYDPRLRSMVPYHELNQVLHFVGSVKVGDVPLHVQSALKTLRSLTPP